MERSVHFAPGRLVVFRREVSSRQDGRLRKARPGTVGIIEADRRGADEIVQKYTGSAKPWSVRIVPASARETPAIVYADDDDIAPHVPHVPQAAREVTICWRGESYGSVFCYSAFRIYDWPTDEDRDTVGRLIKMAGYEVNHTRASYIGPRQSDRPLLIHLLEQHGFAITHQGSWSPPDDGEVAG